MRLSTSAPLSALAALWLVLASCPQVSAASGTAPYDLWYGVFFGQLKIGHAQFSSKPATFEGKAINQLDSTVDTQMVVLGAKIEQHEKSTTYTDPKSGAPVWEDFSMSSGGETTDVTARFFPTYIDAKLTAKGGSTARRVPIPSGTKLSADDDTSGFDDTKNLHVGLSETEIVFNPLTLALEKIGAKVEKGPVPVFDPLTQTTKRTWQVKVTSPDGDQTLYEDEDGDPIRADMPAGLYMLRESQKVALSDTDPNGDGASSQLSVSAPAPAATQAGGEYTPPTDFAIATAVNAGGQAIQDPRTCQHLSIQVTEPDKAPQVIDIQAAEPPANPTLTVGDAAHDPELAAFLSDAPYLSLDSPAIQRDAAEIRGTRTNLYDISVQIHNWVYAHMTPDGTLGLPRTAAAICADPRGVCRDYAILYTALARAAGVPTRLCAGMVAFRGQFYYHAWAESYVGGSAGWLPVDPTMPQMFVDATHVPLAKGDPTVMYTLGGAIGEIKAKVLSAS